VSKLDVGAVEGAAVEEAVELEAAAIEVDI
jgi:hypothetical protein